MSRTYYLRTPIRDEDLESIRVGDVVYLTGTIVTARDSVHKRVVVEGLSLPIDLRGLAIFHAGPAVKKINDEWKIVSIGPTTSTRMEPYEADFIAKTGVKLIAGKGFMKEHTAEACTRHKCIVTIFPGGCGALGAKCVKRVVGVHWLELGVPEAMWVLEVENFGPLIVTIDATGANMYSERSKDIQKKISELMES
ncbi:MAG: fumarate hydratase C-terminal domain-containing protein [Staphylothermus sp.]|nr:fumarate hydratase C-terminal domain-containing protein [Staphylothermus sp.]